MHSYIKTGIFLIILLLSHESITVANNIEQQLRSNEVHKIFHSDLATSLLETMEGMSMEEKHSFEIREMHKSLHETFSFDQSPILNDLKDLKEIPPGKVLSKHETEIHRMKITSLLEKAMSHLSSKKSELSLTVEESAIAKGKCENTNWVSTCGKHSECESDKKEKCEGECICDDKGINSCE